MRNKRYENKMKMLAISYIGMVLTLILAMLWN